MRSVCGRIPTSSRCITTSEVAQAFLPVLVLILLLTGKPPQPDAGYLDRYSWTPAAGAVVRLRCRPLRLESVLRSRERGRSLDAAGLPPEIRSTRRRGFPCVPTDCL